MANRYYYLISSLPYLRFEERPPITKEQFLSECRKWLDPTDLRDLNTADIKELDIRSGDPEIIKDWKSFDIALRENIADIRRSRKDASQEKVPVSFKEVFKAKTPLLVEKRLDRMRWDFIEDREVDRHFDINTLLLYSLKLQILERHATFDQERGKAVFEGLCEVRYA